MCHHVSIRCYYCNVSNDSLTRINNVLKDQSLSPEIPFDINEQEKILLSQTISSTGFKIFCHECYKSLDFVKSLELFVMSCDSPHGWVSCQTGLKNDNNSPLKLKIHQITQMCPVE